MKKRILAIVMVVALMISVILPIAKVFAVAETEKLTVSFRTESLGKGKVEYSLDDGDNWIEVTGNLAETSITTTGTNFMIKIVPGDDYDIDYAGIELTLDGNNVPNLSSTGIAGDIGYIVASSVKNVKLMNVEFTDKQGTPDPSTKVTSKVTLSLSGEELEYNNDWSDDASDFSFAVNNALMKRFSKDEVVFTEQNNQITGLITKEDYDMEYDYDGSGNVTFHIRTQWDDVITSLLINGDPFETPDSKEELEAAFENGGIAFDVTVPYSTRYDIVAEGRKQSAEEKIMGNFGWTYDENTNQYSDDDKILHGRLEFVSAEFNNVTYNSVEAVNNAGGVFNWYEHDPYGEAAFPSGTVLTLKLIPDAGYQLIALTLNGAPFEPGNEPGVYTFTIGGGNWHLGANFSEVGNELNTSATSVRDGNINLNLANDNSFRNGTAKLEVSDIASMSPSREADFVSKAEESGYEINSYIDMSLFNTIYKGGKTDANGNMEAWDTQVDNIVNDASISLELNEDMTDKEIVLIHETHNGNTITGYEIIETDYNVNDNTISFTTNSFSNYAIATKAGAQTPVMHTVEFDSNGGSAVAAAVVEHDSILERPTEPTKEGYTFGGWYIDPELNYSFDFEGPVQVDFTLYARWIDDNNLKDYTVTDDAGNSISFTDEEGHTYKFTLFDILSLSKEEIMAMDPELTDETYNQMMDLLNSLAKPTGTLLKLYEIEVYEDNAVTGDTTSLHEGPFKIKIKITDDMKVYNTFKLVYLKNDFTTGEVINLTVEGDYLVGTIPHLSTYMLTGSVTTNPKTGDNVLIYMGILVVSIIALFGFGFYSLSDKKTR